ncbi:MAG: DUF3524 domain-containing protein [Phycisphaerales bacterium]|nr:DUF3524 domain-containing protein [Phycisphaerales bacterium]
MASPHDKLRVLALEPYYGGSHQAFLDTWVRHSRHDWQLITMPARHWKWRMRGSAMWFADQIRNQPEIACDVIFTCDMTSVADLRAMLPARLKHVPIVCYFHENQLTYPLAPDDWRDYQYAFTNITSANSADAVWFNSQSHIDAFAKSVGELLRQMPDHVPGGIPERIAQRAQVQYPAIECPKGRLDRPARSLGTTQEIRPLRILWCHRWEFDKNPEAFFAALSTVRNSGAAFEIVLLGEQFRTAPAVFAEACESFADQIVHAGYLPDHTAYLDLIATCDVVVSTAIQENFGIAVVEAILAGNVPLLPNRLSYPELVPAGFHDACLYESDATLADRLVRASAGDLGLEATERHELRASVAERFAADKQVQRLDDALLDVVRSGPNR